MKPLRSPFGADTWYVVEAFKVGANRFDVEDSSFARLIWQGSLLKQDDRSARDIIQAAFDKQLTIYNGDEYQFFPGNWFREFTQMKIRASRILGLEEGQFELSVRCRIRKYEV